MLFDYRTQFLFCQRSLANVSRPCHVVPCTPLTCFLLARERARAREDTRAKRPEEPNARRWRRRSESSSRVRLTPCKQQALRFGGGKPAAKKGDPPPPKPRLLPLGPKGPRPSPRKADTKPEHLAVAVSSRAKNLDSRGLGSSRF